MKHFAFPKKSRLVSNRQFKAVLSDRGRRRRSDRLLTLYTAENDCGYPRLGVSVGKSHGNAVVRNRLKRLVREAFRQSRQQIPSGFDYVVLISPGRLKKSETGIKAKPPTFEEVRTSFLALANAGEKNNQRVEGVPPSNRGQDARDT